MSTGKPASRDDFSIAIICALDTEYNAVALVFDQFWDEIGDVYGKADGDTNHYTTGRIAQHDVVLTLLPQMGKVSAAGAAASMRSSFRSLRLALLVGVCGGVPVVKHQEVLLGDVIISELLVQYDFGRQYSHQFDRKDTIHDNLGRPNTEIRALLAHFRSDLGMARLETGTAKCLEQIQSKAALGGLAAKDKYKYPGTAQDMLFRADYRHKHQLCTTCICQYCVDERDPVCEDAMRLPCHDLGCDRAHLVRRSRLDQKRQLEEEGNCKAQNPSILIGAMASGDSVIKSARHRDKIAEQEQVIGFEMEGAGIWDQVPSIVIKGVCDYADSHKKKGWQSFAAATAAAVTRTLLERYTRAHKMERLHTQSSGPVFYGNLQAHTLVAGSTLSGGTYNFN